MVKADYWVVEDGQVIDKTGQPLAHWDGVARYWARTLTTRYLKARS